MPRLIESFRSARSRIKTERLAVSAALSLGVSASVQAPLIVGYGYGIHEMGQDIDSNLTKGVVVGLVALLNILSVAAETKALKSQEFSVSPIPTTLHVFTQRPLVSSITGHLVNNVQIMAVNPINSVALLTQNTELLAQSAAASSLALTTWFIALNTLISYGKIDPVVRSVQRIKERVRRNNKHES